VEMIEEAGGRRARSGREKVNEHVLLCIGFVTIIGNYFLLLGKINLSELQWNCSEQEN